MNSTLDQHEQAAQENGIDLIFPAAAAAAGDENGERILSKSRLMGYFNAMDPRALRTRALSARSPHLDPDLNPTPSKFPTFFL